MLMRRTTTRQSRGFTLVELMISVVILGIVASIALPAWSGYTTEAHQVSAMTRLSTISMALEEFRSENRTYDTDLLRLRIDDTDARYTYHIRQADRTGYRLEALPAGHQSNHVALSLDALGRRQHRIAEQTDWRSGWP